MSESSICFHAVLCHYSYFKTFSHELPKISHQPCDVVYDLFFSQGPRVLFQLYCVGCLGQCLCCGFLEMSSQILAAVCFRNQEGIKRPCCGKTGETSAEGWEEVEEEEEVTNQMQQQGSCSSFSSTLTTRYEPAVIKGLAPQHRLQSKTGLRSAS